MKTKPFILYAPFFYFLKGQKGEIMREYSEMFGWDYDTDETVLIVNPKQRDLYILNGAKIKDIYPDSQKKLIYVFTRESTRDLYTKWLAHTLV